MTKDLLGGLRLPRSDAAEAIQHLLGALRPGMSVEEVAEAAVRPEAIHFFHTGNRIQLEQLMAFRFELIEWARLEWAYPQHLGSEPKRQWNVALGQRLGVYLAEVSEAGHPQVHCWLASRLFPDLVLWRWPEPKSSPGFDGAAVYNATPKAWWRFTTHQRNAMRLAWWRVHALGAHVAGNALEDEFLSVLERPGFGADPRVARLVLEELIADAADRDGGPDRGTVAKDAMIPLSKINSLHPLRYLSDDGVRTMTRRAIAASIRNG